MEVLRLQKSIEQLGQSTGNGLEHICFAPVIPTGTIAQLHQCTIQSVFGYFGNSIENFNFSSTNTNGYIENYLNTLDKCFT